MKTIYEILAEKRDGKELTEDEIGFLVSSFTTGEVEDYQFSAFLMAAFIRGLSDSEMLALTDVMLKSGKRVVVSGLDRPLIDKHSTGGVGDKLSLIISPLLAQCGIAVGMVSGRSLGHTGGTLDKLESIPDMKVFHSDRRFATLLRKHHFAITGQTAEIAPADKKIYALRDVTGTVESTPLIVASIMSKKLALNSDGILFDVKTGSGAFMKEKAKATRLSRALLSVCRNNNLPARAVITNMNQPTGRMIGNFLEVVESVETLRGEGPDDTMKLSLELSGQMFLVAGIEKEIKPARAQCRQVLKSGRALEALCRYVADCGGDASVLENPGRMTDKAHKAVVKSRQSGYIAAMDTARLGYLAGSLGAGRVSSSDRIDPIAGIEMLVRIGDRVSVGDELAVLYTGRKKASTRVAEEIRSAIEFANNKPVMQRLVLRRIGNERAG